MLEPLLEHTDLVDVNYLIALGEAGGVIPRWQDLPDCARINTANVWRLRCWDRNFALSVLVLSYPWLDRDPPDRLGETLRRILPILRALREKARQYGTHGTVGVLWDYMSLPQRPYRSEEEGERFKKGLYSIVRGGVSTRGPLGPHTRPALLSQRSPRGPNRDPRGRRTSGTRTRSPPCSPSRRRCPRAPRTPTGGRTRCAAGATSSAASRRSSRRTACCGTCATTRRARR